MSLIVAESGVHVIWSVEKADKLAIQSGASEA
jgi:hypothetical protein